MTWRRPRATTNLPPSGSEGLTSFDRLHPLVRRWIRNQGWAELRDVQDRAIPALLQADDDVLIAAATAGGKTEAAFLPILTRVSERAREGLAVLYVSPLKALINDQFRRLDELCEQMDLPVTRWHGDAPQSAKQRLLRQPQGLVLITPESIEALLIRKPTEAQKLFEKLEVVVIDELHAFLQGPRGLHLASLLNRVERLAQTRPQRVGLSATLGDFSVAARWLNPAAPDAVRRIESTADRPELRLQIRGYLDPGAEGPDEIEGETERPQALDQIADHLFATLRGHNNLVFGGSRRTVEALADRLRRRSEAANLPNEFFPHHGSLSKELREELEFRLKAGDLPTTGIATSTLELGVDIGSVTSVAQIGAPRSISALKQRLGRSGRRAGMPATLRVYLRERELPPDSDPLDRLRSGSIRAIAAIRLLLDRFVEAPREDPAAATVVLHQVLSLITQLGGLRADVLYRRLCATFPLSVITPQDFADLLRGMADPATRLVEQAPDGAVMLGEMGERLTQGRDFYAIFETDQEWRLVAGGRTLGTIPLSNVVAPGSLIAFAGRRWKVKTVDDRSKVLEVASHPSARLPKFDRLSVEPLADRLVAEMRKVYLADDVPSYLDASARAFLREGRGAFQDLGLGSTQLLPSGQDTHVLTWRGTAVNSCLAVAMTTFGLECEAHDLGVTVAAAEPEEVATLCRRAASTSLTPDGLSQFVESLREAKYDSFVPEALLRRLWARRNAWACVELGPLFLELGAG